MARLAEEKKELNLIKSDGCMKSASASDHFLNKILFTLPLKVKCFLVSGRSESLHSPHDAIFPAKLLFKDKFARLLNLREVNPRAESNSFIQRELCNCLTL